MTIYLDKKLVKEIQNEIAPFKISNFITKLFLDYLENKDAARVCTSDSVRTSASLVSTEKSNAK